MLLKKIAASHFAHPGRILGGQVWCHGLAPVGRHRRGCGRLPAVAHGGHTGHVDWHQVDPGVEAGALGAAGRRGGNLVVENLLLAIGILR